MSIKVVQRGYLDHLNRNIGFPIANQIDTGTYTEKYQVFFGAYANDSTPIQIATSGTMDIIISGTTWEEIGIVAGDTVNFKFYDNEDPQGDITGTGATVQMVNGDTLSLPAVFPVNFISMKGYIYCNKLPQSVETQFSLSANDATTLPSFIDNTVTSLKYNQVGSLSVSGVGTMSQMGIISGSIIEEAKITRNANVTDPNSGGTILSYTVSVKYKWHGYLSVFFQDYFFDVKTVKPLVRTTIYPQFNNMGVGLTSEYALPEDGNSGFRDENFNQGVSQFTVTDFNWQDENGNPIGAFDYSKPSIFNFTVDSLAGFGTNFGLMFFNDIQDLDTINPEINTANGGFNHARHTILADKADLTATTGQTFTSFLGTNGEQVTFSDIDISVASNTVTVSGKITPNAQFIAKFSNENQTEKGFALLFRSETASFSPSNYSTTVNSKLWVGIGEIAPVVLGAYPTESVDIYDHVRNSLGAKNPFIIIEDDNRLEWTVKLDRNRVHRGVTVRNVALNTVTGEFFTLESYIIPFDQTILTDGTQAIDSNLNMYYSPQFPATALNRNTQVYRDALLDDVNQYGAVIKFAFLERWEYWMAQSNVDVQFFNTANKDWLNYQVSGQWTIAVAIELEVEEGSYRNVYPYEIEDYEANDNVTHRWEFSRLDGTIVTTPLLGEVINVKSIWESTTDIGVAWCMETAEIFEGQQRFVISSAYDQVPSPQNPLIPVNGASNRLRVTGQGTTQVVTEYLFDPNSISTQGGVSFTARLEDLASNDYLHSERVKKTFQLVQLPVSPENQGNEYICCDCEPQLVLASSTDNTLFKNDFKSVFHKLDDVANDTVIFHIYKEGEALELPFYGVTPTFPKDNGLRGRTYNWRDYLINHGAGCYKITKSITVAGISFEIEIGHYTLREYSLDSADGTTRVIGQYQKDVLWSENGQVKRANFGDSNYEDCMRFAGTFGEWTPNNEVINHVASNGLTRNVKNRFKGKYSMTMKATTICHVDEFVKEKLLFSSLLKISTTNYTNPNQRAEIFFCVPDEETSHELVYTQGSRLITVNVSLQDMYNNEVSRNDGSVNPLNGVSYALATIGTSGTGGVCTPATVELQDSFGEVIGNGTFASGSNNVMIAPDATSYIVNKFPTPTWSITQPIPSDMLLMTVLPNQLITVKDMNGNILNTFNRPFELSQDLNVNVPSVGSVDVVGEVFNTDFDGSIPSELTNTIATTSFDDGLKVESGSISFDQTLSFNEVNGCNDWSMTVLVKINDLAGATYGFAIGSVSVNTTIGSGTLMHFICSAGDVGKLRLYRRAGVTPIATSSGALSLSVGDVIEVTLKRTNNVVQGFAFNKTTQSSIVSVEYAYDLTNTTDTLDNTGKLSLVSFAGGYTVQDLKINNLGFVGATAFLGDSVTSGYFSNPIGTYVDLVQCKTCVRFGGQGDKSLEVVNYLPQITTRNSPKYAVIMIGINDCQQSVSLVDYEANLRGIITQLQGVGTIVYVVSSTPTLNPSQHYYSNKAIDVAVDLGCEYIDAFSLLSDPVTLQIKSMYDADGIHPNSLGHKVLANKIIEEWGSIII